MNALPSKKNKDDQETGMRVTQEVAKAYLGKAYLFQKKYQEAASVLNEVVDSKSTTSSVATMTCSFMPSTTTTVSRCWNSSVATTKSKLGANMT